MNNEAGKITIAQAIIRTIVFYDLFDFPLTPLEIQREAGGEIPLKIICRYLKADERLREKWGFYFLPGREEIVTVRQQRHNYGRRKLVIARRYAKIFGLSPWVRGIFLANSFGAHNLRDNGDIDLFIISAPGRLWLSRLYCTGLAELMGKRPRRGNKRDRLCLSFYISAARLNMSPLDLDGDRLYYEKYRQNFVLLYNKGEAGQEFMAANGSAAPGNLAVTAPRAGFFEKLARAWQLSIMPRELKAAAQVAEGVVIDNFVLKFHQHDRRRELIARYEKKIKELN